MNTVEFNGLFGQAVLIFILNIIAFIGGIYFTWRHNASRTTTDVVEQLTADNKAYQRLLESLKNGDAVHTVQISSLMSENGELKGRVHALEQILKSHHLTAKEIANG